MNFSTVIKKFIEYAKNNRLEIYNEFSLQFELAFYLRKVLGKNFKIQLERNTSFLNLQCDLIKKEIDILLFKDIRALNEVFIVELKTVIDQSRARPITVFNWIKDLKFLEQLKSAGVGGCYSLFVTNNDLLISNSKRANTTSILLPDFRKGKIQGTYSSHSKSPKKGESICLSSEYTYKWEEFVNGQKFFLLDVS
jgi:hypothetical protein